MVEHMFTVDGVLRLSMGAIAICGAVSFIHPAKADEAYAKSRLQEMSSFLGSRRHFSVTFTSDHQVVSDSLQKIAFVSSGKIQVSRPDRLHAVRNDGFSTVEMFYDGATLTVLDQADNIFARKSLSGSTDELIDRLKDEFQIQAPGSDLLFSNVYAQLMPQVTDIKDIGSGIVRGVECDHFAFRTEIVDWEIWIASGSEPFPCRYVVTSKMIALAPEYRLDVTDWRSDPKLGDDAFRFKNLTLAREVEPSDLRRQDELPDLMARGGNQ